MKANGNKLSVDFAPKMGVAKTDATKLRQVALNLISNAAKFTRNGTITVTIRRDRTTLGDWIEMIVRDTGIGISEEELGRLFANFNQASASTSSRFGGTGLGLAHSQKLAGLMGGRISVTSEVGKGSAFTVRLPADLATIDKSSAPEGMANRCRSPWPRRRKEHTCMSAGNLAHLFDIHGQSPDAAADVPPRLLIVDDVEDNRTVLARRFERRVSTSPRPIVARPLSGCWRSRNSTWFCSTS